MNIKAYFKESYTEPVSYTHLEKTGVIRELRSRQAFTKPSIRRREQLKKAKYVQKMQDSEE